MEFVDRPLAKSEEEVADLIILINKSMQNNEAITWSVTLKDDTKLIGTIGFWKITKEHYRAEIGYLLNADYQGKGIMNEALTEVLKFGFQTIRLPSVEANVNPKNAASIKLLIKNGFNREAYFRENYYFNGQFLDSEIYSLINPES
jgi:ribosomal-protein-alanine N-acetyltransferase